MKNSLYKKESDFLKYLIKDLEEEVAVDLRIIAEYKVELAEALAAEAKEAE